MMGLQDPTIQFGTADEFVGGYLVRRHVTASGRKAHAMLPLGYVRGATRPVPSPTYPYRPCGTGVPGEQPPVHMSSTWLHWERSCQAPKGSVSEKPRPHSGRLMMFQYPGSFRRATVILMEPAPDFPGEDNQAEVPMVRVRYGAGWSHGHERKCQGR